MTLWYRAPEVILDNLKYSEAVDLWSAGVIIFEMLTGKVMFEGNSEIDMIFKIFNLKGTPVPEKLLQNKGLNDNSFFPINSNKKNVSTAQTVKSENFNKSLFKKNPTVMKKSEENTRPVLVNYESFGLLNKYGIKLPLFTKKRLVEHEPSLKHLGFSRIESLLVELIDGLTDLEPSKRLDPKKAIEILDKIESLIL